jgi:tRNA pseudouridine38-40 synthase
VRIALGISYSGTGYLGWQSQPNGQTLQDHLELALTRFAGQNIETERIATLCAGRTDAGVHGLCQVVHFDTPLARDSVAWVRGTNRYLPSDMAVQWAQTVPHAFHARACAKTRRYVYVLLESPVRPSLETGRVGWVFQSLDGRAMQTAANHLLGEHDFSSFRASMCQALSPVKNLHRIDISKRGAYWRFEFEANAFLHHMIRNIMGCLIAVGKGHQSADWIPQVLAAKSRLAAAPTFSPDGLYFVGPVYDAHWGLPQQPIHTDWLP